MRVPTHSKARLWAWLCSWVVLVLRCSDGQVVTLSTGKVRGERVSGAGCARDYWAFRGIRYAASPVGELRFKAPRPAASWEGVADATVEGSPCPQVQDGVVIGCEDCLNLNVYTPTLDCPAGGYAVIVFFHGGYFVWGDIGPTPVFGPDFLVNEDVVLILPNYRLGALGFLNLNTPAVPGNAGIKDGVEALRWVRANAAAFCGDSARVTIMGQSAGAKMAAFLSLTEAARGLFRAAIQMSGTATSPIAYTEQNVERARALAQHLGCDGSDAASVERTLLQADYKDLAIYTNDTYISPGWGLTYNLFAASPECRPEDGEERVLTRDPAHLLWEPPVPRVPTLVGVTSGEGILASNPVVHNESSLAALSQNFTAALRAELAYVGWATAKGMGVATQPTDEMVDEIARRVKDKYFQGREPSAWYPTGLSNLIGDMRYTYPLYRWVTRLDRQRAPLYLYLFDQVTDFNFILPPDTHVYGVSHADDLGYLFRVTTRPLYQNLCGVGRGNHTLREHLRLITDFAKYLISPAIQGNDVKAHAQRRRFPPYLYIGRTCQETRVENTLGAQDRMAFWDDIKARLLLNPQRSPANQSL